MFFLLMACTEYQKCIKDKTTDTDAVLAIKSELKNEFSQAILTFDDGPHPKTTPALLKLLHAAHVKNAVFFLMGSRVKKYPELVKQIDEAGYAIGYHSMTHKNQVGMTAAQIDQDIQHFKVTLENALDKEYALEYARPPFGGMSRTSVKFFNALKAQQKLSEENIMLPEFNQRMIAKKIIDTYEKYDLKIWLWNIDFKDWEQRMDLSHAENKFNPNIQQVWLFHEMPEYKKKVFNNKIVEDIPYFLNLICNANNC